MESLGVDKPLPTFCMLGIHFQETASSACGSHLDLIHGTMVDCLHCLEQEKIRRARLGL